MPVEGRDLSSRQASKVARDGRLGNLATPVRVQELQTALHAKAKAEPGFRFYALYDKVSRADILDYAYRCCKANKGAAGVDEQEFVDVETYGVQRWLGELAQALREQKYRPEAVRRVYIKKRNGKLRPLGIPTLRERVCQTATMLVLESIFEADLPPEQYAYRAGTGALEAVRQVHRLINTGHREVVDADLSGYLDAASYCPLANGDQFKRSGWSLTTLIRSPLRRPRDTCTACSSPRFTRCNTVWRETPSLSVVSSIGRYSGGACCTMRARN
jgi:RNA-directed DNA polymerase